MKSKDKELQTTLDVKDRLLHLFSLGFKEDEACMCVGITMRQFNDMLNQEEGLETHFKKLQGKMLAKSHLNIAEAIDDGDVNTSKWYIEQKRRERQENEKRRSDEREVARMGKSHFDIMRESLDRDYTFLTEKPN